jgi:cell division GTPase FtsZ
MSGQPVSSPHSDYGFEGRKRGAIAEAALAALRGASDVLLVIEQSRLLQGATPSTSVATLHRRMEAEVIRVADAVGRGADRSGLANTLDTAEFWP